MEKDGRLGSITYLLCGKKNLYRVHSGNVTDLLVFSGVLNCSISQHFFFFPTSLKTRETEAFETSVLNTELSEVISAFLCFQNMLNVGSNVQVTPAAKPAQTSLVFTPFPLHPYPMLITSLVWPWRGCPVCREQCSLPHGGLDSVIHQHRVSSLGKWQDDGKERSIEFFGAQILKIRKMLAYSAVTASPKTTTPQRFFV